MSRKRLGEPLKGHRGPVRSLAFSADGRTLASGSEDDTVMLWDVASRKGLSDPLTEGLARRESGVLSIAFSPDSKTLASAGRDRSVTLWDVDVESWIRRACAIANRNLTRVEWAQYSETTFRIRDVSGVAGAQAVTTAAPLSRQPYAARRIRFANRSFGITR